MISLRVWGNWHRHSDVFSSVSNRNQKNLEFFRKRNHEHVNFFQYFLKKVFVASRIWRNYQRTQAEWSALIFASVCRKKNFWKNKEQKTNEKSLLLIWRSPTKVPHPRLINANIVTKIRESKWFDIIFYIIWNLFKEWGLKSVNASNVGCLSLFILG